MPSKNMIRKGKRRQTVKPAYRAHRDAVRETQAQADRVASEALYANHSEDATVAEPASAQRASESSAPEEMSAPQAELTEDGLRAWTADEALRGKRLDAALARLLPKISRARVQLLIENGKVRVNGKVAKASLKLVGGEHLEVEGDPEPPPLHAEPEDIPLTVLYEDEDLAVIDKPAGMQVHAGAGDLEHNRGTLVNALLFHFQQQLSHQGGALRPGIVHRLDKETSGLILVAKNDAAHQRLAAMFESHDLRKAYIALVHGWVKEDEGTIDLPVGRDAVRRTRMTTRRSVEAGARPAVSHWRVLERLGSKEAPGPWGAFTLLEVVIETGRTHQIRVHLAAVGHPVAGDTLYGAPGHLRAAAGAVEPVPTLERNFLHAAELELLHPGTGEPLSLASPLPPELVAFLDRVRPVQGNRPGQGKRSARVARIQAK